MVFLKERHIDGYRKKGQTKLDIFGTIGNISTRVIVPLTIHWTNKDLFLFFRKFGLVLTLEYEK